MLKIKKSKKSYEIHVGMGQPLFIFDRYFILALTAAFTIHLIAASLFHVRLFSVWEIETILPATKSYSHIVKSVPEEDVDVIARINREGRLTPAHLVPIKSFPALPKLTISRIHSSSDYLVENDKNPFLEMEEIIEDRYFEVDDIPLITSPVKVAIFGPLAEIPLQTFDEDISRSFVLQKFSLKNLHQERIVYDVQVDLHTGQIFWFQAQRSPIDKKQTIFAEKLLKNISFQINEKDFVQSGQIEITFTSGPA